MVLINNRQPILIRNTRCYRNGKFIFQILSKYYAWNPHLAIWMKFPFTYFTDGLGGVIVKVSLETY